MQLNTFGFTRSGYYNYNSGYLTNQSSGGYYWSRTRGGTTDAYYLFFRFTSLYPRNNIGRGRGYPLRCLAR